MGSFPQVCVSLVAQLLAGYHDTLFCARKIDHIEACAKFGFS